MALEAYRRKRDFRITPEPKGGRRGKSGNSFVVQKHDARRLHYDFRLELGGVLKSWAVARGPSLVPGEKRLAVHTEDHPLGYGDFEGTIPKGEYGGGTVIIWDRGTWKPLHDAHKAYAKGHLEFELSGKKLAGRWHLVRMGHKPREKRENWLLIKGEDEAARAPGDPDILVERPESVKTGREVKDVAGEAPGWSSKTGRIKPKSTRPRRGKAGLPGSEDDSGAPIDPSKVKGAKRQALPGFIEPALATLASSPPAGARWLHEIKFDGYRVQARIESGQVRLLTRSGLDWTKNFGRKILIDLQDLSVKSALIDGELVVETDSGASDFPALQADLSKGRTDRFAFYVFDLLHLNGYNLQDARLVSRKKLLEGLIRDCRGAIRYSGHFEESGQLVLRHACRLSLEGVVSKLRDAPYRSGRGKSWVKSKCSARQEFVVAGYVPSTTTNRAIGSLVLGVHEGDSLHYVGRVGTGFAAAVAQELFKRLDRLRIPKSPFARRLSAEDAREVRFVRPEVVVEVEFRGWSADGMLRHGAFRGLREDKPAREIVREKSTSASRAPKPQQRTVKLTHPDRLYWPDEGVTKEGLADYYAEIWHHVAPFMVGRPLALVRCPNGIRGEHFFQKHAWKGINPNIVQIRDPKEPAEEPLISINDLDGLLGLVQAAVLEIHPWGSTATDWERPDMITMDLDPGEDVPWSAVIDAARETRDRLKDGGLASFVKTSGGKGLHVIAPLQPKAEWPAVKAFTKGIADAMAADSPDRFVSTITKSKRRGKILVDYLRNQRGTTAVAAYSTRARPGAAVSMPLGWEELGPGIGPAYFTVSNTPTRLTSLSAGPWEEFRAAAAPLEGTAIRRRKAA
jgi:bifunctional non-homologous end joining protein LigD